MSQSSFDSLLQKYLSGNCTEEEEKIVLEWYETLIKNSELHLSDAEKSQIEAKLWNSIKANVQAPEPAVKAKVVPLKNRLFLRIAVAAGVAGLIVAGMVMFRHNGKRENHMSLTVVPKTEGYQRIMNESRVEKTLVLADSTVITLQPEAIVYYPPVFTQTTRDVYLTGSAFFKVYHNPLKHFKVHMSGALTTEVLGTSFNIMQNERNNKIEVAVVSGRVCVYRKEAAAQNGTIVLTPNKKVTFNAATNQFTTGLVDHPQPLAKAIADNTPGAGNTVNALDFEEAPLHAVLQTLSKLYGISITMENERIANVHFTGNISKYELYTQLDILCKSTQTTYEINGTDIIVKENQNR